MKFVKPIVLLLGASFSFTGAPSFAQTSVEVQSTGKIISNINGGIKERTELISSLDITLDHPVTGIGGNMGLLHVGGMMTSGANFSEENVGDLQTVSNIDGFPNTPYLAELWYEQSFSNDTLYVLAGLFDLNSEFDGVEAADLFFNASRAHGTEFAGAGTNGTGAYPITPLAARVKWVPSSNLEFRLAVAEGTPRDPDNLNDIGLKLGDGEGALVILQGDFFTKWGARISAAHWGFTSEFDVIAQPDLKKRGNSGTFAIIEGPLGGREDRGLYGFARMGVADARFNEVKKYIGAGLYYKAPFGRENDRIGFGVAKSELSERVRIDQGLKKSETNYEAAYHFQFNENLGIAATAQYIESPGAHPDIKNATVLGLRVTLGQIFEWQ